MSTVHTHDAARPGRAALLQAGPELPGRPVARPAAFAALPQAAAFPRLPARPRLSPLEASLWWVHAMRRTLWRWQRRQAQRGTAPLLWC
jgi:hypothetical protein